MHTGVAVVAGLVLAVIAFRRARGVLHPEARREATRQAIGTRSRRLPPATPRYEEILALHEATVRRGGDRYRDPLSGLWVMTATYLWERGYCCYSMCRHCPWVDR